MYRKKYGADPLERREFGGQADRYYDTVVTRATSWEDDLD
jgi:hypothetical protein